MDFNRLMMIPVRAWEYSMRHPEKAFVYSFLLLIAAWLARLALSVLALILIISSLREIYVVRKNSREN